MTHYLQLGGESLEISEASIERSYDKQETAIVMLKRGSLGAASFSRGETEAFIAPDPSSTDYNFGGLVRDVDNSGARAQVILESFERYARDGEPTPGGDLFENAGDDVIVEDAIEKVPELSKGVIENVGNVSKVFSHASPAKKIREASDVTGGVPVYNPDKTVDYVKTRGTDRTGIEISPNSQNIAGNFKVKNLSGPGDVTHLRVLGAGEGESQQTVNLIPADDPETYVDTPGFANVQRYNADHWSTGQRKQWDSYSTKEIQEIDSLTEIGKTIIEDVQADEVEVETTLFNISEVNLGDKFVVDYPEEGVNLLPMSVNELTTNIKPEGFRYDVTLSTRRGEKEDGGAKDRKDLSNYNMAFEGNSVAINTSGGRQPVTPDFKYETRVYYPSEVKFEHRLNIRVMGLPYRAYSTAGASAGLHQHLVELDVTTPGASADVANVIPQRQIRGGGDTFNIDETIELPSVGTITDGS